MAEDIDALPRGAGAWGQAVMALGMVAVLALAVGVGHVWENASANDAAVRPVTCADGESGGAGQASGDAGRASAKTRARQPRRVSGAELCAALHRSDLAALLGTPTETATSASGGDGSVRLAGEEIALPSAQVEFATYTVSLSATYDRLPVAGSAALLGAGAQERTVLGRPAVLYWDHTLRISFRLDGSDADSGPGVPVGVLSVARSPQDGGDSFELSLWRSDGAVPSDAVLVRVAEKVLPTVPGWAAHG
ncbi:DUF6215 domain-containing protein [Streptomyces sp. NPDC053755]|uniref:DUF6215 domain-containing protein n=1 Tax=Streptomyces sp. NPDC053755 TaxID=3155815 RepID=UPI0034172A3A